MTLTRDFELQATEVTVEQFLGVMGYSTWSQGTCAGTANCPVGSLSWHEAAAYCNALSQRAAKKSCYACSGSGDKVSCQEAAAYSGQGVYDCPGYRLPTEAEWEYVYRAGTTAAYYSGVTATCGGSGQCVTNTDVGKIGWYCGNSGIQSQPVKGKQPNPWGLYDMAGNVEEWCHDWYAEDLGFTPVTDPWGAPSGSERAVRNAACAALAVGLRAAYRGSSSPTSSYNFRGFRCARTLFK